MSYLSKQEAVPVTIGSFTLYCESFKSSSVTVLYEQPTVTGSTLITNKCVKSPRVTFMGRIVCSGNITTVTDLNNMTGSVIQSVDYRGVRFSGCTVQSCSAEDRGDGMLYVSITLAVSQTAEIPEVNAS